MILPPLTPFIEQFYEDCPGFDRTTQALSLKGRARGDLIARMDGVVSGVELVKALPTALGLEITARIEIQSGGKVSKGERIARLEGEISDLLAVERTLLNAIMILSGIATKTRRFVESLPEKVRLLDTRKTIPGLGPWVKKAFRDGGGFTHRVTLADQILIKDNHIAVVGSVRKAVERARRSATPGVRIICEVRSLKEAREAVQAGAISLLIDNIPPERWSLYWENLPSSIELEFSGGIREEILPRIPTPPREIWVSASEPIMSAPALDISLEFTP
jgi:nicotinate-nucleotide pyrophosphorylase (carboxylating)